jgi:hypothetical protein
VLLLRPWSVVADAFSNVAMKGNCSPTVYLSIYPVALRISIIKSPFQITTLCPLHGSFSSVRKQHIRIYSAPGRQVIDPLSYQVLSYLRDAPRDLLAKYCLASAGAYVSPNVTV